MNGVKRGRTRLFALILRSGRAVVVATARADPDRAGLALPRESPAPAGAAHRDLRTARLDPRPPGPGAGRLGRVLVDLRDPGRRRAIPARPPQALAPLLGCRPGDLREARGGPRFRLGPAPDRRPSWRAVRATEARGHPPGRPSRSRFYPKGRLASAVLGFVGTDDKGLAGLEHLYDDAIRGNAGRARRADGRAAQPVRRVRDGQQPPGPGGRVADPLARLRRAVRRRARARRGHEGAPGHVGQRRRDGSPERRDPRDGLGPRLRPERVRQVSGRGAPQPRHRGRLRAGLDVQDRDGGSRPRVRPRRARRDDRDRRRNDPHREYDDPRVGPPPLRRADARRDLRALLQRRHHPRRACALGARPAVRRRQRARRRTPDRSGPAGREPRHLPAAAEVVRASRTPRSRWARRSR